MSDAVSGTVLRDILAGCEGVTPGPWERRADPSHYDSVTDIYAQGFIIAQTCGKSFDGMEARAAHIARLDPQTIASIVSELIARREADEPSDAAINAAAKYLRETQQGGKTLTPWSLTPPTTKKKWLRLAKGVLAAASDLSTNEPKP
jgi:hypothetical protein